MNKQKNILLHIIVAIISFSVGIGILGNSREMIDFDAYYTGAKIITSKGAHYLYDLEIQREFQRMYIERYKDATGVLTYRNPPIFAFLISPLGYVSYSHALGVFTAINVAFLTISLIILWKLNYITDRKGIYLTITYFPIIHSIYNGQITIFILLTLVLSMYLSNTRHHFLAGLVGSLSLVKFQRFVLTTILTPFIDSKTKYFFGIMVGTLLFFILNWALYPFRLDKFSQFIINTESRKYGTELTRSYSVQSIVQQIKPNLSSSQNFTTTLVVSLVGLLFVFVSLLLLEKKGVHVSKDKKVVILIFASLLFGIHTTQPDNALIVVPLLYFKQKKSLKILTVTYLTPLLGFVQGTAWIVALSSLTTIGYLLFMHREDPLKP